MNSYGWKHFFYLCLQKLSFSKSLTSLFINFWNFKTNELLSAISPILIIGSLYNPWVCGYHYFIINGKKSVSFLSSSEAKAGVSFMNGPRKKIKYLPSSFKLIYIDQFFHYHIELNIIINFSESMKNWNLNYLNAISNNRGNNGPDRTGNVLNNCPDNYSTWGPYDWWVQFEKLFGLECPAAYSNHWFGIIYNEFHSIKMILWS